MLKSVVVERSKATTVTNFTVVGLEDRQLIHCFFIKKQSTVVLCVFADFAEDV
jgi:hypothetical protein